MKWVPWLRPNQFLSIFRKGDRGERHTVIHACAPTRLTGLSDISHASLAFPQIVLCPDAELVIIIWLKLSDCVLGPVGRGEL